MIRTKSKKKTVTMFPQELYLNYRYKKQPNQCDEDCQETVEEILKNYIPHYIETLTNGKLKVTSWDINNFEKISNNINEYKIEIWVKLNKK